MNSLETWELVVIGALVLLVLLWVRPGLKRAFEQSRQATSKDWAGVLVPIGLVVLFIILLISLV